MKNDPHRSWLREHWQELLFWLVTIWIAGGWGALAYVMAGGTQ